MQAMNIPLAGKYGFKLEGFPVLETVSFTVNPHDSAGVEKLLMGAGTYEEFGPGDGTLELKIPKADLMPWEVFNGQGAMAAIVASVEPLSGVGPCWDLEGFVVTNPGSISQSNTGSASRTLKLGFANLTKR